MATGSFRCSQCQKHFSYKKSYDNHVAGHIKVQPSKEVMPKEEPGHVTLYLKHQIMVNGNAYAGQVTVPAQLGATLMALHQQKERAEVKIFQWADHTKENKEFELFNR